MDLQTLLQHLPEILRQEASNASEINLYRIGKGYWAAFEQSAYNLAQSMKESEIIPMRLPSLPFPIVMATTATLPRLQCTARSEGTRRYSITGQAGKATFNSWHRQKTRSLAGYFSHRQ